MALTVGDKVPSFDLPVQQGIAALPNGESLDITTAYPGKWKILFYWPKDFHLRLPDRNHRLWRSEGRFC